MGISRNNSLCAWVTFRASSEIVAASGGRYGRQSDGLAPYLPGGCGNSLSTPAANTKLATPGPEIQPCGVAASCQLPLENEFGMSVNGWTLPRGGMRSEEHTSELQSLRHLVC